MTDFSKYITSGLISPNELNQLLSDKTPNIAVLDASYGMGAGGLSPETVFQQLRISDAQFFDIDAIADHNNPLPHMLPQPSEFAAAVGQLGISNDQLVVVYDQTGIAMAACRAWWMFRIFGHSNVCVLDGGLPAWQKAALPLTSGDPTSAPTKNFIASFKPELVASYEQMRTYIEKQSATVLDARPAERFAGLSDEPRPGVASGHMPGALSLPAGSVIDPGTRGMKGAEEIASQLDSRVSSPEKPIITTCGSGVTACVVALALFRKGYDNVAVYDGSWTEWAQEELSSPVIKGFE